MTNQSQLSPYIDHELDAVAADKKLIEQAKNSAPIDLTTEDVNKAIDDVFDIQERSLLHFIWLGDMAKTFKEKKMTTLIPVIDLAVASRSVTKEVQSNFEVWKFKKEEWGWSYVFSVPIKWSTKIPVNIYVYHHKFDLFDNPNTIWASVDYAYIPNPFDRYWTSRNLILHKLKTGKPLSKESF